MLAVFKRICTRRLVENLSSCSKLNSFSTICLNRQIKLMCYHEHGFQTNLQFHRFKSKDKNKSKKQASETETEESDKDFIDEIQDKYTKTVNINVTSMRLDVILKTGLGLSRNKLETIFYESRIRLNGEKVLKKSMHIQEGDEIDVIKGLSISNKSHLTIARVEILSAVGKEESIGVKLRRCKSLTVENYEGKNRWDE